MVSRWRERGGVKGRGTRGEGMREGGSKRERGWGEREEKERGHERGGVYIGEGHNG